MFRKPGPRLITPFLHQAFEFKLGRHTQQTLVFRLQYAGFGLGIQAKHGDVGGTHTIGGVSKYWFGRNTAFMKRIDGAAKRMAAATGMRGNSQPSSRAGRGRVGST